jgi:hypothetical protein
METFFRPTYKSKIVSNCYAVEVPEEDFKRLRDREDGGDMMDDEPLLYSLEKASYTNCSFDEAGRPIIYVNVPTEMDISIVVAEQIIAIHLSEEYDRFERLITELILEPEGFDFSQLETLHKTIVEKFLTFNHQYRIDALKEEFGHKFK